MANVRVYAANVDELHPGDNIFWGERKMIVVAVNREDRRVLVTGRKHSCKNCEVRWIDERRLGTRPRSLAQRKIKSLDSVRGDVMDGITSWVPTRPTTPTDAPPGSWEKIAILRARIERGEPLWHRDDASYESSTAWRQGHNRPAEPPRSVAAELAGILESPSLDA